MSNFDTDETFLLTEIAAMPRGMTLAEADHYLMTDELPLDDPFRDISHTVTPEEREAQEAEANAAEEFDDGGLSPDEVIAFLTGEHAITAAVMGFEFDPKEPRDDHGRWTEVGGVALDAVKSFTKRLRRADRGDKAKKRVETSDYFAPRDYQTKKPSYSGGYLKDGVQNSTHGMGTYQANALQINGSLRDGSFEESWKSTPDGFSNGYSTATEALDQMFTRDASKLKNDIVVHRGILEPELVFGDKWSNDDNVGLTWVDPGFVSTSWNEGVARGFTTTDNPFVEHHGKVKRSGGVLMNILVPKGAHALRFGALDSHDQFMAEDEIVLPRESKFRIVADHGLNVDGTRHVDVELIPRDHVPRPVPDTMSYDFAMKKTDHTGVVRTIPNSIDVGPAIPSENITIEDPEDLTAGIFKHKTGDDNGYDPNQPRDAQGQWTRTGTSAITSRIADAVHGADVFKAPTFTMASDEDERKHGALATYASHQYSLINSALEYVKNNDKQVSGLKPDLRNVINEIDDEMARSTLKDDIVVYRGIKTPKNVFGSAWSDEPGSMIGVEFRDSHYASTSSSANIAMQFSEIHRMKYEQDRKGRIKSEKRVRTSGAQLRILAPRGSHAVGITSQGEGEILLPRDSRFRIVGDHVVDGDRLLDVEVLQ